MHALTESQIRASFANASRREVKEAPVPSDLTDLPWEDLDILGWTDDKAPQRAYVVIPPRDESNPDEPTGVMLRTQSRGYPRPAVCDWCQDPQATDGVVLYVARRSGKAGRNGNTIGAMVHANLTCSTHARRKPTPEESGRDPEAFVRNRIDGLRDRTTRFVERIREAG